jgi:hypothetical protein
MDPPVTFNSTEDERERERKRRDEDFMNTLTNSSMDIQSGNLSATHQSVVYYPYTYSSYTYDKYGEVEVGGYSNDKFDWVEHVKQGAIAVPIVMGETAGAAFSAAGATGWTIGWSLGKNIESVSWTIAGVLIKLGAPPEKLIEPGYGDPNKWVAYKTKPATLSEFEPEENHFPPNNNKTSFVAKVLLRTAGVIIVLNELGVDGGKVIRGAATGVKDVYDKTTSYFSDLKDKTLNTINGFQNWNGR